MNRDEGFGRRQILNVRGVCGYFVDLGILGIKLIIYECFDVESEGNSICTNEKRLYGIG